ncbi:carboxymuconolactone decarboxylase family protein [Streptomyces sp. NPDC005180]|uniref:carboxymuconolactone decarboxylase family protein n=1 Tax=Streptomyces sp. NPDC005180 TaxID=3156868 RepID=UPI0033ABE929
MTEIQNPDSTAAQGPRSRMSDPMDLLPDLREVSAALFKVVGNGSVPQSTMTLVHLRAGQIVGNTYLTMMHTGILRRAGETEERITAVSSWQDALCFTAAERAALALVEAVLTPAPAGAERVPDEVFARAAEHFDDKAMATLVVAIGQVNFFIPLALIGKPLPGMPASKQWT